MAELGSSLDWTHQELHPQAVSLTPTRSPYSCELDAPGSTLQRDLGKDQAAHTSLDVIALQSVLTTMEPSWPSHRIADNGSRERDAADCRRRLT
jgi:hypothetical protein